MLVSNCNKIIVVDCGCTIRFTNPPQSPSYGILELWPVTADGCTITDFMIYWYLDAQEIGGKYVGGTLVLITGSSSTYDSSIQQVHPTIGSAVSNDIPLDYIGTLYPVLRRAVINGIEIYGEPTKCKNYCELNLLPYVVLEAANCAAVGAGNTSISNYNYGVYYSPAGIPTSRDVTFKFTLDTNHKYLAVYFQALEIPDTIKITYNGNDNDVLTWYEMGTGTGFETPGEDIYLSGARFVVDYAKGRTVLNNDFVLFTITAGSNVGTVWKVGVSCFAEEDFEITPGISQCNYLYPALREYRIPPDIDGIIPTMTYDKNTCSFILQFYIRNVISNDFILSNLWKYTNISEIRVPSINSEQFTIDPITGLVTAKLLRSRIVRNGSIATNSRQRLTAKLCWHYNPNTNTFIYLFYSGDDFINGFRNWGWVSPVTNKMDQLGSPFYTTNYNNKTDIWYYRVAYYTGYLSARNYYNGTTEGWDCSDTAIGVGTSVIYFHPNSIITRATTDTTSMAELRFRAKTFGGDFTSPSISEVIGLDAIVINRIVKAADTIKHDAIHITGNSGSFIISGPGKLTYPLVVLTTLTAAVNKFVEDHVAEYDNAGIELTAYTDFIGKYITIVDDSVREDFVEHFVETPLNDTTCNNRYTFTSNSVDTVMSGTGTRTVTLSVAPSVHWDRGDIVIEQSTGASFEVVGRNNKVVPCLIYDIKNTVIGTFSNAPTLEVVGIPSKTAIQTIPLVISAKKSESSGSTGCYNWVTPHGWKLSDSMVDEKTKDFSLYYEYPLTSLNSLCANTNGWVTESGVDRFRVLQFTVNFDRTVDEVGLDTDAVATLRENNFTIYNRLTETGELSSILQLNVAPTTSWTVGDLIRDISTGAAYCTIVSQISSMSYYVTGISGTFPDDCIVGVVGNTAKQANQLPGAPRIIGPEILYQISS